MKKRANNSINILIVDDNTVMCQTLKDILTEDGYKITGVGTIALARKELAKKFYNLALVDFKLPNGSGLELLKEIKKVNEKIKVIVFTGFSSLESGISALDKEVFAYIQKPFNVDELKLSIKKALKMQKLSLRE